MDNQRAQEIVESLNMIHVNYHGIPIFIQEVHADTATIFPLDEMDHIQQVELEGLFERKQ